MKSFLSNLLQKTASFRKLQAMLKTVRDKLENIQEQYGSSLHIYSKNALSSIDIHPWDHPFLTPGNISRFRHYSEQVWQFALDYLEKNPAPLNCAFMVNMAQNMYKWGCIAKDFLRTTRQ
jgi:hypothetical protein